LPHSSGRYAAKRFRKAQCPIVERLVNSLMMHGRNNGKKLMTVRIVNHSFEIIHLLSGEVKDYLFMRICRAIRNLKFNALATF
jgi:small subunit ribosomal protein S5e